MCAVDIQVDMETIVAGWSGKVTWVWLTALQTFFQMQVIIQKGVAILDMTPYDAVQWLVEVFSP